MAFEAATNCWTKAQASFMTALANSARFQELLGAADSTEAAAKIFGQEVGDPNTGKVYTLDEVLSLGSHAQVYSDDENPYGFANDGSGRRLPQGNMIITVDRMLTEAAKAAEEVPLEAERSFENRLGDAMEQFHDYLMENSGPYIGVVAVTAGPSYNSKDKWKQVGIWQAAELSVQWGYTQ